MPSRTSVYKWLEENKAFADRYARSVEFRAEKLEDEMLAIADNDSGDFGFKNITNEDGESAEVFVNKDNVQRARLRVDTRKWIASKLYPRKYGEFTRNEVSGPEGKAIEVKGASDADLDRRLSLLLGKAGITPLIGGEGAAKSNTQDMDVLPGDGAATP